MRAAPGIMALHRPKGMGGALMSECRIRDYTGAHVGGPRQEEQRFRIVTDTHTDRRRPTARGRSEGRKAR